MIVHKCGGDCNVTSLLVDFCLDEGACSIGLSKITASIGRLCVFAQEAGKSLCDLGFEEMHAYVHHLYSLEGESYTKTDSELEINIITLFYDFLVSQGCMAANPVREL